MLKLMFIPIVLLIATILLGVVLWLVYRKLKKGVSNSIKKGAEIATEQQEKWVEKGQRKKLPSTLQKGFDDYDRMEKLVADLPEGWKQPLQPIVKSAKEVLDEVAFEYTSENSNSSHSNSSHKPHQDKKLNSIRSFFHHSLAALLQLVEKLSSDHAKMDEGEIKKARENIVILKADLLNHQETLHKVRRFDFDVVMDVIKARLKK